MARTATRRLEAPEARGLLHIQRHCLRACWALLTLRACRGSVVEYTYSTLLTLGSLLWPPELASARLRDVDCPPLPTTRQQGEAIRRAAAKKAEEDEEWRQALDSPLPAQSESPELQAPP